MINWFHLSFDVCVFLTGLWMGMALYHLDLKRRFKACFDQMLDKHVDDIIMYLDKRYYLVRKDTEE